MTFITRRTKQLSSDLKRSQQPITFKKEIGDYWLGKTIGRGASGRVKLGINKYTGEKVAIKMIARSHLSSSSTTAKSVQRELAILQLLHHPHLVELKQVLQDTSYVYFVMEYLQGGELFHVLAEKGKLKENDAKSLFYQMVSALAWCHAHHICHRDLKPENILLDKTRKLIKIADFGMSTMNTSLKTSCGSPHYASPEIVKGKSYDGTCADVWSLGVILFALLSGHLPFDDEHMGRLLGKIKSGKSRPLPTSVSNDAKHLVKKMLVVDPSKRIKANMNEILGHPWLASMSSPHAGIPPSDPLKHGLLDAPVINHSLDLEGRIWETLKVLWRDLKQEEIIQALSSQKPNLQKLTFQHHRRSSTPPLSLNASNVCLASLHVKGKITQQSVTSLDSAKRLSTTYNLMEQLNRQQSFATTDHSRSSRSLSSVFQSWWPSNNHTTTTTITTDAPTNITTASDSSTFAFSNWWSKTLDYVLPPWFKKQPKLVSFDYHGKHECEVAGKIHQVLKEQFHGKLRGHIYPNQQIVWNGTLKLESSAADDTSLSRLWFLCHMVHQHGRHFKVNFIYLQGDITLWNQATQQLISKLTQYEHEANNVMAANGW
ncbi:kinase-like domain-containing protein [Halteromyces radiatus]|uniref:kinase-like domain-containing protein n=1 Tax=Halteromyces radiatus TaxID=101107 RepID=UPI002220C48B|nr:kinase-like domain-containing protein [Halteromyces radiatus]KAI8086585.1 kinase-like domain-containing protein [Halteromyces radiatus]